MADKRYFNFNPNRQPAIPHVNIPGSVKGSAVIITGDYAVQTNDSIIICDSAVDIVITLRQAMAYFGIIIIKNINIGVVTVQGIGSPPETIDGEDYQQLHQWDCMLVLDYLTVKWVII